MTGGDLGDKAGLVIGEGTAGLVIVGDTTALVLLDEIGRVVFVGSMVEPVLVDVVELAVSVGLLWELLLHCYLIGGSLGTALYTKQAGYKKHERTGTLM